MHENILFVSDPQRVSSGWLEYYQGDGAVRRAAGNVREIFFLDDLRRTLDTPAYHASFRCVPVPMKKFEPIADADIWALLYQADTVQNEYGSMKTAEVIRKVFYQLKARGAVPLLRRLYDGNMQPDWEDPKRGMDSFSPSWYPDSTAS